MNQVPLSTILIGGTCGGLLSALCVFAHDPKQGLMVMVGVPIGLGIVVGFWLIVHRKPRTK